MKKRLVGMYILAVLLSVCIWIQIKLLSTQTVIMSSDIQYKQDKSRELANYPPNIRFRIQGQGLEIVKFWLSNHPVYYEPELNTKDHLFSLQDIRIDLPNTLTLIDIYSVEYETKARHTISSMNIPIKLNFHDSEARKLYSLRGYRLSHDSLRVIGSLHKLKEIKFIKTYPVSVNMLNKDKIRVRILPITRELSFSDEPIYIYKDTDLLVTKVIGAIPIDASTAQEYFPKFVTVRVKGKAALLKNLKIEDFKIELDLKNSKQDQIPLKVTTLLDLEILEYSPTYINVRK